MGLEKTNELYLLRTFPTLFKNSIHHHGNSTYAVIKNLKQDNLIILGELGFFEGIKKTIDKVDFYEVELNAATADRLRALFPFTRPSRVLRETRTFGLGDRLGLAGVGHLQALKKFDAFPVLAQQSMRELHMTKRDYQDVLDRATFAVFKMGYHDGFGADGDHLKTPEDIRSALALGYTMITLDCSDYIREIGSSSMVPEAIQKRFLNRPFTFENYHFVFTPKQLEKAYTVYQDALNYTQKIYQTFFSGSESPADFELSIDETKVPTTPEDHIFVAEQLSDMGVKIDTLAPRFCGEFQKGIDYIGSIDTFEKEISIHAAIASAYGYKLSIHSGSDKFSIFASIGELTKGRFHLKTAGTSWLEAMHLVAAVDPALYRDIHTFALSVFEEANKLYHVSARLENIPPIDTLADNELVELFKNNDARQLIHITYGYVLNAQDGLQPRFKSKLYDLWHRYDADYAKRLEEHIGHHLSLLYKNISSKGVV